MVLDGRSLREHPVHAEVPHGSIIGPKLFQYTLKIFLMMLSVILLSMLMKSSPLCLVICKCMVRQF